jgi:hypothetical protein
MNAMEALARGTLVGNKGDGVGMVGEWECVCV